MNPELLASDENLVLTVNVGDKYSLRPRSVRRGRRYRSEEEDVTISSFKCRTKPKQKQKQKSAPLSKYKRKTANARERSRMREINTAFEALRRAIPHLQEQPHAGSFSGTANEKLTKITTLRLAMNYISILSETLNGPENRSVEIGDLISDCSDLDCLFLESDGESFNIQSEGSEHSLSSPDNQDECLTPVDLTADFNVVGHLMDSPTFTDHTFSPFDSLFPDFS